MTTLDNSPSKFYLSIADSPTLKARWDAVSASVIAHAKTHGVVLTHHDCERLPSVTLAVLDGVPLEGSEFYERELASLPAMVKQRERTAKVEALARGDDEMQTKLAAMTPSERMTFARENGLDKARKEGPQTADQEASQFRTILTLNPQQRIAAWRRMKEGK